LHHELITLRGWSSYGSLLYDLGAVVLAKKHGQTLFDAVGGGQGISFNRAAKLTYWSFGYPAGAPFNGESLHYCRSPLIRRDSPVNVRIWRGQNYQARTRIAGPARIEINCNMTGGSSGGGWIAGFDPNVGGWIVGVNSTGDNRSMESPYLGAAASDLWIRLAAAEAVNEAMEDIVWTR
jgi:hypothetical protein